ncbi:DinB family protein [Zhihengliuella somnathii]
MSEPATPPPDDPPCAASERGTLLAFIDYYRAVMLRKAEGLTREELARTVAPSTMSLVGMIKHLAYVEHEWFAHRLDGRPMAEPWANVDWAGDYDWDWNSAAADTWEDVATLYLREVEHSREIMGRHHDLEAPLAVTTKDGQPISLRWMLVHLVEEYARHAGHADLLREAIDGSVGD